MTGKQKLAAWLLEDVRAVQKHPDFPAGLILPWMLTVQQLLAKLER